MGQIKEKQIEIPEKNPFQFCKLGREIYAKNLTEIIQTYSDGFVLAIDNKWGDGKTTFIKMWESKLRLEGYTTVYFNSWENDLEVDPFIGIMAEFKKIGVEESIYEQLVLKAGKISTNALPILLKGLISKFIGNESLKEILELISKESSDFLGSQIDKYSERKESIKEFKSQLSNFVEKNTQKKPLIYFIDELDRCRPDYAVLVLEKIKHLFSVPGIVFVLSIDKDQLCNSIKGFYGSDRIDSVEYLKRFIDIEYILPSPEVKNYCSYLFERYGFSNFFHSEHRSKIPDLKYDSKDFLEFAISLSVKENLSLRSMDKLFSHSYLVVKQFASNNYFFAQVVFWLTFLRMNDKILFDKIVKLELTPQEFIDNFEGRFFSFVNEENETWILYSFVRLVRLYTNQYKDVNPNFNLKNHDDNILNIKLGKFKSNMFLGFFDNMSRERSCDLKINHLLNKINLFEQIKN